VSDVAISMRGLTKRFDKKGPKVVDDVSLDIKSGTIYGLIGAIAIMVLIQGRLDRPRPSGR